jgi:hypothetical protein
MRVAIDNVCVGRVVSEDEDFMLLEVIKNEERKLQLDPETPDKFHMLMFVHQTENGIEVWKPWESQ